MLLLDLIYILNINCRLYINVNTNYFILIIYYRIVLDCILALNYLNKLSFYYY